MTFYNVVSCRKWHWTEKPTEKQSNKRSKWLLCVGIEEYSVVLFIVMSPQSCCWWWCTSYSLVWFYSQLIL